MQQWDRYYDEMLERFDDEEHSDEKWDELDSKIDELLQLDKQARDLVDDYFRENPPVETAEEEEI